MSKQYSPLLKVAIIAIILYVINRVLFLIPDFSSHYEHYRYSLEILFAFFTACSLGIVLLLIWIHKTQPDNTGYTFLAATTVKMGVCFFMLRPILSAGENAKFEKANFFILFILFLATETIVTIKLLNKK